MIPVRTARPCSRSRRAPRAKRSRFQERRTSRSASRFVDCSPTSTETKPASASSRAIRGVTASRRSSVCSGRRPGLAARMRRSFSSNPAVPAGAEGEAPKEGSIR